MRPWHNRKTIKRERNQYSNNRINLIMAIVFLLGGLTIGKLYSLQIMKYDLYTARASGQHQIFSKLEPERGKIFIQDNPDNNSNNKFYPIATNKEFALVYAIPKNVKKPRELAEQLYKIFKQTETEKEVDELLDGLEKNNELNKEFRIVKREAEINLKKEIIIEDYLKILTKKNDPYEPIAEKVDQDTLEKIKELKSEGIDYIIKKYRYYPEGNIGSHMLGFVGFVGDEKRGRYGLEGFFDQELFGKFGSIKAERSATSNVIIINDREYSKPENGRELILTINRTIQWTACQKLNETALRHGAEGGSIIIMEPQSGAILAMCSWPDYNPNNYNDVQDIKIYNNPVVFDQYEPGSIFKVITMAAGLDQGKVTPETTYNDQGQIEIPGWPKPIKNSDYESHGGHGIVDMNTVLVESLNTGAIYAMQQIGEKVFADYVKNFGFGEKTGIELETESAGDIRNLTTNKIKPIDAAVASFGQGIAVTPLQMITACAAIANGGILVKPYLVQEITHPDGLKTITKPQQIRRVISERTALLLSAMTVNVVDNGHAKRAGVKGYYVAGKTGTAQVASKNKRGYSNKTIHTFVGFAPVDEPKFVMLVKLDDPKDVRYAASSAAPLFGEIAEFMLNYWQVPKER